MAVRLGDTASDFTAPTTQGEIHFHDWLGDSLTTQPPSPTPDDPKFGARCALSAMIAPDFGGGWGDRGSG